MRLIVRTAAATTERRLEDGPLLLGDDQGATAAIALAAGRPFVQPLRADRDVFLDDARLAASHWLHDGQHLRLGDLAIEVSVDAGALELETDRALPEVDPEGLSGLILQAPTASPVRRQHRVAGPVVLIALALLGAVLWYVFSASMLELDLSPVPDSASLDGGLPAIPVGDGYLIHPGRYTLRAERSGYRPLVREIEVGARPNQRLAFALERLPGRLSLRTPGVEGAQVLIDGEPAGVTPLRELELEAGDYELRLRAERHLERVHPLHVEGLGTHQALELTLTPAWAPVTVESTTAGTELWVDGEPHGPLPLTVDLDAGTRRIEVRAPGYKPYQDEIEVLPDQPRRVAIGALEPADGTLVLRSRPPGANVAIDGRYAGRTPLSLALAPGQDHRVTLSKRGHRSASRSVSLSPEERRELEVALSAETGTLRLAVRPDDARLVVEGRSLGRAQGRHALPAYPQLLEIRREGFAAEQVWVTPRPGFEQTIEVTLQPRGAAAAASLPGRITAPDGTEMILIRPGALTMGASRREPGRRANEVMHRVELARPFYLARTEVTNAQFRRFMPEHRSGRFQAISLDDPGQPVVNVTWAQAAGYCNWLNEAAGMPAVYRNSASGLTAQAPLGPGYRLPTEAEWAWAARRAGRERTSRFPWGEALPPQPGSGNFADESVSTVLADTLQGYDDGRAGTAPPGSFAAGPGGAFDLAGNVAEWVHDYYAIRPQEDAAEPDPTGPADGRHHVIRGSSWMHASVSALRWTYRDYGSEPRPDVGFRCARYATEAPGP